MAENGSEEHESSTPPAGMPAHPPTSFGVYYPEHDIVAVIDDHAEAEKAIQALIAAGIPADHVHQVEGKLLLERDHELRAHQSLAARVGRFVSFVMSDTGSYQQEYVDEAAKGHHLIIIQAPEPEDVDRVRDVLAAHHAHLARHYGSLAVADLIP